MMTLNSYINNKLFFTHISDIYYIYCFNLKNRPVLKGWLLLHAVFVIMASRNSLAPNQPKFFPWTNAVCSQFVIMDYNQKNTFYLFFF